MRIRTAALALLIGACAAPPASAAPWGRVTTPDGASTDQVALARTADGVLHVVWSHPTSPNTEDLLHTALSPAGRIGATSTVQSGWTGVQNAALVVDPGGLRAFWGGQRSTDSNDPQQETNTAVSRDGGASWALQPGSVVPAGAQSYGSPMAATVRADGTTMEAFAGTLGTWVHAGLSPATPNHDYQAPLGPYGYDPNLATDASNRTVMAWYSNSQSHLGVFAQDVNPDGSPGPGPQNMPGTSGMQVGMLGRTPLVARRGGGLYVAYPVGYPSLDQIRLWQVGAARALLVGRVQGGSPAVAIAADGDGRLWVVWTKGFGDPDVLASRSNENATRFGAVVNAGHPRDAAQAYKLDASAAGGALDLFGNFNIGTTSTAVTSHTRVLPGLTLRASRSRVPRGEVTNVRFTVTDAGEPVKGAKVTAGGDSGRTNRRGRVTLSVKARRPLKAKVSRSGYTRATRRLAVRR